MSMSAYEAATAVATALLRILESGPVVAGNGEFDKTAIREAQDRIGQLLRRRYGAQP